MNNNYKNTLPFKLKHIPPGEWRGLQSIEGSFPAGASGIGLHTFADLLGLREATLKLASVNPSTTPRPTATVSIALSATPSNKSPRFVLGLPIELARIIVDRTLNRAGSVSRKILTSGEQGVLLYALDRAGGDWMKAGGGGFVLRGFLADFEQVFDYLEPAPHWRVTATLSGADFADQSIDLWLNTPLSPAKIVKYPPPAKMNPHAPNWPVALKIVVGWSNLSTDDVHNLTPGDLVVLDRAGHPAHSRNTPRNGPGSDPHTVLYAGKWTRWCRWDDSRSLIVRDTKSRDKSMETNTKNPATIEAELRDPSGDDSDRMEVVVTVEIGHVKMTVAEAAKLLPGATINLDRDVGPEVSLRIGDKLVAKGQLVEYERRLAVEVMEVL